MIQSKDLFPKGDFPDPEKTAFIKIVRLLAHVKYFRYIEIGSYLGGSLAPLLAEDRCSKVLSIDKRGRIQLDQRGQVFDYTSVTEDDMIKNLVSSGFSLDKLKCFDGSIEEFQFPTNEKYDFLFIDGEHTNAAVFRDFIYAFRILAENSVILFDDSNLVFDGIQNCKSFLDFNHVKYRFLYIKDTRFMLFLLNDFASWNLSGLNTEEDISAYFRIFYDDLVRINAVSRISRLELLRIFLFDRGIDRVQFHAVKGLKILANTIQRVTGF
jgi:predicted O-methyltransferase YrrM